MHLKIGSSAHSGSSLPGIPQELYKHAAKHLIESKEVIWVWDEMRVSKQNFQFWVNCSLKDRGEL